MDFCGESNNLSCWWGCLGWCRLTQCMKDNGFFQHRSPQKNIPSICKLLFRSAVTYRVSHKAQALCSWCTKYSCGSCVFGHRRARSDILPYSMSSDPRSGPNCYFKWERHKKDSVLVIFHFYQTNALEENQENPTQHRENESHRMGCQKKGQELK